MQRIPSVLIQQPIGKYFMISLRDPKQLFLRKVLCLQFENLTNHSSTYTTYGLIFYPQLITNQLLLPEIYY